MAQGLFRLRAAPDFVLAASNLITGASVVLTQQTLTTDPKLCYWNFDPWSRLITLAATLDNPTPLVLTAPASAEKTKLVVNGRQLSNDLQKWAFFNETGVIASVGAQGKVVDNSNGYIQNNNPIWLYTNNNSISQQWYFNTGFLAEAVVEELEEA